MSENSRQNQYSQVKKTKNSPSEKSKKMFPARIQSSKSILDYQYVLLSEISLDISAGEQQKNHSRQEKEI